MHNIKDVENLLKAGIQHQENQDYPKALEHYDKVLELIPDQIDALYFKSIILIGQFEFLEAEDCLRRAISTSLTNPYVQQSTVVKCHTAMGSALQNLKRFDEAVAAFKKAIELEPEAIDRQIDLIQCYLANQQIEEAAIAIKNAQSLSPNHVRLITAQAEIHFQTWNVPEYIGHLQKALKLEPTNLDLVSQYLMSLNYLPADHGHQTASEHIALGEALQQYFFQDRDAAEMRQPDFHEGKNLRIGFISPDLKKHSVTYFLIPLLRSLQENSEITTFCYSTVAYADAVTQKIQTLCDGFRTLKSSRDFNLIEKDAVDILIDLAGHTNSSQFEALVRNPKLAPLYVQWLGYPNTSGFSLFDFRIVDRITDPALDDYEPAAEQKLYLEPCFLCYEPPENLPAVNPLPALDSEVITLGSFNNLNKVTPDILHLWASIMAVDSRLRLLIKNPMTQIDNIQQRILSCFDAHRIDRERIQFMDRSPDSRDHYKSFHQVDISLDTHPYGGTTTTFESLVMGCPVVTLCGMNHRSRVGKSILEALGMEDWVAASPEEYAGIIQTACLDLSKLADMRANLRAGLTESVLCDRDRFAQKFVNLFRKQRI